MAIVGSIIPEWLSSLALRSEIPAGAAFLDLGPQDLLIEAEPLRRLAARHLGPEDSDRVIAAIFDGRFPRRGSQRDFYSLFGAGSYHSIDRDDPRADFALDLNLPVPEGTGTYDVVTNFGTTEHVFNIGQAFASIHNLLKIGGLQLHAVQSYGYIDHGFYNFHPCAFLDVARANAYEIVDLLYIDNINVRGARPIQAEPFDFSTLPIQLRDVHDTASFMTKVAMQFQRNLLAPETAAKLGALFPFPSRSALGRLRSFLQPTRSPLFLMFDQVFVALRKTSRSPETFVTPIQGV